jgi:hypothetical protein
MALGFNTTLKTSRANQIVNAAGNSAVLTIYDGTKPAAGGTVTQALAALTCNTGGFGSVASGVITVAAINNGTVTSAGTSTASWFRLTSSGGTFVMDGTVGTSGTDLVVSSTSFTNGQAVSVTSWSITEGN